MGSPPRLGPPYLPMAKQLFRHIAVQTSPNRRRNLIADPCADRPAGLSSKKDWLCPRKWLMLFSLKFQRNNQKNASAMDSAKGKTGKKAVFSPCCGDETTTHYDRAIKYISLSFSVEKQRKPYCYSVMDTKQAEYPIL